MPRYTIAKTFKFSASHQLFGLEEGHPCGRLHGHNYTVTLILEDIDGEGLDDCGMLDDFRSLDVFKKWLDEEVDHRHLNDLTKGPTTSERLAHWFYVNWQAVIPLLAAVRVSETDSTFAEYRP